MCPLLSILTPAIPERLNKLQRLAALLEPQLRPYPHSVEWLTLIDPRGQRTIGEKRDELVQLARGQFLAFVDDDDFVSEHYVAALVDAISRIVADQQPVDVITFRQEAIWCGLRSEVRFNLRAENEDFNAGFVTQRAEPSSAASAAMSEAYAWNPAKSNAASCTYMRKSRRGGHSWARSGRSRYTWRGEPETH